MPAAETGRRARRRAERAAVSAPWLPPPPAWIALLAYAALLMAAAPESNWVWAVNGFRSVPPEARIGLVVAAVAALALALLRARGALVWTAFSAVMAWSLAYPLREKIHFLGESSLRIHTMAAFGERAKRVPVGELFASLHAAPLDVLLNFLGPIAIHRLGPSLIQGVSVVSLLEAALFFAGVWRLSGRLTADAGLRLPIALALALAGTLQTFAGYAESTGLLLALVPWWWAELLDPLPGVGRAMRVAGVWLVLLLAHPLSLVLILPMLWRALGPPLAEDRPAGRHGLLVATVLAAALGIALLRLSVGPRPMGTDFADALALLHGEPGVGLLPPADVANLLLLVAPLAVLAPFLAGRSGVAAWMRAPAAQLALVALVPLLPLAVVLPAGPHGLGAHRDWDLAALCGWTLTVAGTALASAPAAAIARRRLALAIPLLALGAGSWVAVNADEGASVQRALAMASRPPLPAPLHVGSALVYLGQRAMDLEQFELAARYYERAHDFSPNPRFLLLAAEARGASGDLAAARRDVARARAAGGMIARALESAREIERMIAATDSAASRRPAGAAPDSTRRP